MATKQKYILGLLLKHFQGFGAEEIATSVREFPIRMRVDVQKGLDDFWKDEPPPVLLVGLHKPHASGAITFPQLWEDGEYGVMAAPLQFVDTDIGEDQPVSCLKTALWLLDKDGVRHAMLLSESGEYGSMTKIRIEVAVPFGQEGKQLVERYFKVIEDAVRRAKSYRGKVLSLEQEDRFTGEATALLVHDLRTVDRDEVVLPQKTLALLERNVFDFFDQRSGLAELGLSVKKGLLFYGPPGTGKTHTIHYLASRLNDHTTFLITAEQVGRLDAYMTLARLLQPSIVVIEDADLIAQHRYDMDDTIQQVLLNKLLNQMDGLTPDAEILFILTTNRPEALEEALTSRPGRIDQAIEFPLPDADGRRTLARLYARGLEVSDDVMENIVKRTDRASAAFIKELMRRAAQYSLSAGRSPRLGREDVEMALDELLFASGRLNASILGAKAVETE